MKLRLHHNSIRLRLNQPEVKLIGKGEAVVQNISIGDADIFSYGLYVSKKDTDLRVAKHEFGLAISLPLKMAGQWANSGETGIYKEFTFANGNTISLIVEKDFQCLHKRPGEDETDNYPNPKA